MSAPTANPEILVDLDGGPDGMTARIGFNTADQARYTVAKINEALAARGEPADPFRGLLVVAVEVAPGDTADPWTPAGLAGYLERVIADAPHVRAVQVITAHDSRVIAFQDGHGAQDLPWRTRPTDADLHVPTAERLADACDRFHPGEACQPGRNHPAANR